MTNAESLYIRLESGVAIIALLKRKEPESAYLEFKGCVSTEGGGRADLPTDKIKEYWSKAISGFANSGGGVLVWGIDARKGPDGVDCAKALAPHSNAAKLRSKLIELGDDATDPPLMGLDCKALVVPGETEAGFVVALIPEGNSQPYQARWADEHYYFRCGDSFRRADRAMLRKLFYPRSQSRLVPSFQFKPYERKRPIETSGGNRMGYERGFSVRCLIANLGTATADEPHLEVRGSDVYLRSFPASTSLNPVWERDFVDSRIIRSDRAIHVGHTVQLDKIPSSVVTKHTIRESEKFFPEFEQDIEGALAIYTRDSGVRRYRFQMPCREIHERLADKPNGFKQSFTEVEPGWGG